MQACRRIAAEYVAKHLHGLQVMCTLPPSHSPCKTEQNHNDENSTGNTEKCEQLIATHSGTFHCDEAMACGLLRHTGKYATANVIRTRDMPSIEQADIVVDVGTEYDVNQNRFDHHQPSFRETMQTSLRTYRTRLSSAGLIYKHFGKEVIHNYVTACLSKQDASNSNTDNSNNDNNNSKSHRQFILNLTGWPEDKTQLTESELEIIYDLMYKNFFEEIDGVDNGVMPYALADSNDNHKLIHNYEQHTSLGSRVNDLQSWWNERQDVSNAAYAERTEEQELEKMEMLSMSSNVNASFVEAVEMTCTEFFNKLSYYTFSWLPARNVVLEAFNERESVHPSGAIVAFKKRFCPFKEHLFQIEETNNVCGSVLYVIFPDNNTWRVQAVPKEPSSFECRKCLPYRGLRGAELSAASNIDGGVFVHVSGFIGGMTTYEGALKLAIAAL